MADGPAAAGARRACAVLARGGEEVRSHKPRGWRALSQHIAKGESALSAGYGDGGVARECGGEANVGSAGVCGEGDAPETESSIE